MSIINKNNMDTTTNDYNTIKVPSELIDFIKQELGDEVLWESISGKDYIRQERNTWGN